MGTIKIKIWPDGSKSEIKVEGVAGEGCEALTKSLEDAVMQSGSSKERTPEYYMAEENVLNQGV